MSTRLVLKLLILPVLAIMFSLSGSAFASYHEDKISMSISTDNQSYTPGDLVKVDGVGAQSYSIIIRIISSDGEEIQKLSTFKTGAGDFATVWLIPGDLKYGIYTITASDASQTTHTTITIGTVTSPPDDSKQNLVSKRIIPNWFKKVTEYWITDQADDNGFVQVIDYLIQQEIITIPYAKQPEGESSLEIPSWIKMTAEFWVKGKISNDEFALGLEWLINNGIIRV